MKRDIVVVGASAGGIEALLQVVAKLPSDLAAAVFVVVHVPAYAPSRLPEVLSNAGPLRAEHAEDGARIEPNRIYVAPPDKHIILEAGRMLVRRGPKENRFRPSIDALFRSAAYVFGPRVIGVVLSGALDDGTSGLWSVKRLGGTAVIQDPADALHAEMPLSAKEHVEIDHVVHADQLGELLGDLVGVTVLPHKAGPEDLRRLALEVDIAARAGAFEKGILDWGKPTTFTCPECHGALVQLVEDDIVRYRCHTGHAYTASALLAGVTHVVEEKLWQAMRAVEEEAMMLEHLAQHFREAGRDTIAEQFLKKAQEARDRAQIIHDSLPDHEQLSAGSFTSKAKPR